MFVVLCINLTSIAKAEILDTGHFYLDGGYTYSVLKFDDKSEGGKSLSYRFSRLGLRGGYRFGSYFGVEAEASFGLGHNTKILLKRASDNVDLTIKKKYQIGAYLVGFFPVQDSIDLLARVGYVKTDLDLTLSDEKALASLRGKQNLDTFSLGAGVQFNVTDSLSARFDYTYYKKDKKYSGSSKTDFQDNAFSVYLMYNF